MPIFPVPGGGSGGRIGVSLEAIAARLTGYVTQMAKSEAYNIINDAWTQIRQNRTWSFQLFEDTINTPTVVSAGTVTTTLGSDQVVCDATASAALLGLSFPFITQRQFRVTGYSIYSIIAVDDSTNPAAIVLTLDRPFLDPAGVGVGKQYMVYQCYYPAPYADFKRWLDWRDMVNWQWLDVHKTRREINASDPLRLYFAFPYWVVPFMRDLRGMGTTTPSSTSGFQLFELYPHPLAAASYMRYGLRFGDDLVEPEDNVPFPITEQLLFTKSKVMAYEWMEANRDPSVPRGQAADYKFLMQAAEAQYVQELKLVGMVDRDLIDLYLNRMIPNGDVRRRPYYSSLVGRAQGSLAY